MPAAIEPPTAQAMTPTHPAERVEVVDALRGFALFGILLVNMYLFSHPIQTVIMPVDPAESGANLIADRLIRFFAETKFYSLFSFLFGLGFSLQMVRAEERGVRFSRLYSRRLLTLFVIGVVHAYFIWVGDILMLYALLGFLLLLYRKAKPKTLIIWAVIFLALPSFFNLLSVGAIEMGRMAGPDVAAQIDKSFVDQDSVYRADLERAYRVYPEGSYSEITAQRASDLPFMAVGNLFLAPGVIGMFLIGHYFGRRQLFRNIDDSLPFFRKLLWWGLILGLTGNLIYVLLIPPLSRAMPSPPLLIAMAGQGFGAPALSLFYVASFTLLSRRLSSKKRLSPLASVGRVPLSNYLAQSIICTLLFYGYGLGLFGQVDKATGVLLTIAIYTALVLLSVWWTSRFQFGPAEWLWRSVTYLSLQPMRKDSKAAKE